MAPYGALQVLAGQGPGGSAGEGKVAAPLKLSSSQLSKPLAALALALYREGGANNGGGGAVSWDGAVMVDKLHARPGSISASCIVVPLVSNSSCQRAVVANTNRTMLACCRA